MHSILYLHGESMPQNDIEELLLLPEINIGDITWVRTGGGNCSVAEYEADIMGEKVFLHLMSQEMDNYWIATWPENTIKRDTALYLRHFDITAITQLVKKEVSEKQV